MILDVDGTLVDSQNLIVEAQRRAFSACGLPAPSRARSLSIVGLSLPEAFTALVGPSGPVAELVEAYKASFGELRADPTTEEPLFPGAAEALARLASVPDLRLGIATGKSRRGVGRILDRHGWWDRFATVQTADDAPSKPNPAMILQAMAEAGTEPDRTAMVGDTTFDIAMARGAGVRAIGVSWGYHPVAALREAGAHAILTDWAEIDGQVSPLAETADA